jgi:hypothetical protein
MAVIAVLSAAIATAVDDHMVPMGEARALTLRNDWNTKAIPCADYNTGPTS